MQESRAQEMEALRLPSLGDLGASRGLEIGAAFSGNPDLRYRQLVAHHCRLIVPEWQLKPRFLRPRRVSPYNFGPSDAIADFASSHGMAFHGHTLFWHQEPIRWAEHRNFERTTRDYGGFLRDVLAHYPQAVSWDVFNEIVEEGQPLRGEFLIETFGLRFIDHYLRLASEAAPCARLAINDYNLECDADWSLAKQDNMLRLVEQLRELGSPLHAVGIQGHLSSVHRASGASTVRLIDRLADLGLDVFISELDVNDSTMPANPVERDRQVADYYEEFLTAVLGRPSVKRVVFWGITDFDQWIVRRQTREKRRTGKARPALFDDRLQPKAAFEAVTRALAAAPSR